MGKKKECEHNTIVTHMWCDKAGRFLLGAASRKHLATKCDGSHWDEVTCDDCGHKF